MIQQCDGCKREFPAKDLGCLRLTDRSGTLVPGCVKDLCSECLRYLQPAVQGINLLVQEQRLLTRGRW